MSKKEFKGPAEYFISKAEVKPEENKTEEKLYENVELGKEFEKSQKEEAPKNLKKIKGYVVDPKYYMETKSQRVHVLARPSTVAKLKKIAKKNKVSTNELINNILESYIEKIEV